MNRQAQEPLSRVPTAPPVKRVRHEPTKDKEEDNAFTTIISIDKQGHLNIPLKRGLLNLFTTGVRDTLSYKERNVFFLFLHIFYRSFGKLFLILPFFIEDSGFLSGLIIFILVAILSWIKIEILLKTSFVIRCFSITEMAGRAFSSFWGVVFLIVEFCGIFLDYYLMMIQIDCIFILYFNWSIYFRTAIKIV